jgi:hypothetical protein
VSVRACSHCGVHNASDAPLPPPVPQQAFPSTTRSEPHAGQPSAPAPDTEPPPPPPKRTHPPPQLAARGTSTAAQPRPDQRRTTGITHHGRQLWEVLHPHAAPTHSHACTSHPTWMPRDSNGQPDTCAGGPTALLPSRGPHTSTPLPRPQSLRVATGLRCRAAHRTARGAPAAPTQAGQSDAAAGLTRSSDARAATPTTHHRGTRLAAGANMAHCNTPWQHTRV